MKPCELPCAGIICNIDKDIVSLFYHITNIKNKKCLCIGYNEKELKDLVLIHEPREVVILTNWTEHEDAHMASYKVILGDISKKTIFHENEFDAILTLSVLEHIHDLENSMIEIKRILKPQGYFYSFFGPVWSSAYGHHIYARPGDHLLEFTMWQMPSHIHLICSKEEIVEFYESKKYSREDCNMVLHWFFETPLINRIMFDKYMGLFSTYFYIVASEIMYNKVDNDLLQDLRRKYPENIDFSTYGGKFLLQNRK